MLAIAAEPLILCSFILRWLFWFPLCPLPHPQKIALRSVLGFTCASCASLTVCRTNHCVRACVCVCVCVCACVPLCVYLYLLPVESIVQLHKQQAVGAGFALVLFLLWDLRSERAIFAVRRSPFTSVYLYSMPALYLPKLAVSDTERECVCVCVWARSLAACALCDIEVGFSFEFNVTLRRRELWESSERKTYKAGSYRLSISLQRSYRLQTPTLRCRVSLSHALFRSLDLPLI